MIKTLKEEAEATGSVAQVKLLEVPPLLLVLESCFLDDIDCSSLLMDVPVNVLVRWESESSEILRDGLNKMNWWEKQFQQSYPATYERCLLLGRETIDHSQRWRYPTWMLWRSDHVDRRVWKETLSAISIVHAVQIGESEFSSSDLIYQLLHKENHAPPVLRTFRWGVLSGDSETQSYFDFSHYLAEGMFVQQLWSIGGGEMCLLLLENRGTGGQELLLLVDNPTGKKQQDLRCWTLNRNVFVEEESDFVLPLRLDGGNNNQSDVVLKSDEHVLVASTVSSGADGGGCFVAVLAGRVVLVFDHHQRKAQTMETWRNYLTDQFVESVRATSEMASVITGICFVLDAFLLVASNDGVIRAHPRSNPKSEYFVEDVHSLVSQMTSLYNVVALIHGYLTLEVRRVFRMAEDPFLGFDLLYRYHGVDCDHAPLLYGPYVIFAGLDGVWYRVLYDGFCSQGQEREEIKIPHRAGWMIVSVKNANWKYLTVVVQDPKQQVVEELFLFLA